MGAGPSRLRVVPLGGLGEIGMNCLVLETEESIIVIDCGIMFPDREWGVDIIHPDFRWLLERKTKLRGIVLTHGHEDHIGALPFVLREAPVPVFGPAYAIALARERLAEHELDSSVPLNTVATREPYGLGDFTIEHVRVTHSIADATGLVIDTPAGRVVHTGDFKIDAEPLDGEHFDEQRLREAGDAGVRLLLSDSTNALSEGPSGQEVTVRDTIHELVGAANGRVIAAIFASNLYRLLALIRAAEEHGRKVCLLGRSVHRHVRVAEAHRYLRVPASLLVTPEDAAKLEPHRLLIIATGTQAEPEAALMRLARDQHPVLHLQSGDEVILSSRIIPGNEQSVFSLINDLERRGVTVHFRATNHRVHVSGHACRTELRKMMKLVRPRAFVPVHGTLIHLKHHARLAQAVGIDETLVVENGAILEVDEDRIACVGQAPVGRVHVDAGEEIPSEVLRDRALLGELGLVVAVIQVNAAGQLVGGPSVFTRGVISEEEEPDLVRAAREHLRRELQGNGSIDEEEMREAARRSLRRFMRRSIGRRPLTYSVVVRTP